MAAEKRVGRTACKILHNKEIATRIFEMLIEYPVSLPLPTSGQFVNLYCRYRGRLLPRPISVCEVILEEKATPLLRLVYAVQGAGTLEFSNYRAGEFVEILGPLGNGFTLPKKESSGKIPPKMLLIGGGVGTPPMVELAKQFSEMEMPTEIVVGFRDEPYLLDVLEKYGRIHVATESGKHGFYGNVVELIASQKISASAIFACGPKPMLQGVQQFATEREIPTQLSLEERMGCGFGACVGCVVKIIAKNKAGFLYKKVCKDGPIFNGYEVIF